ncbi:MAG: hypothetical protein IV090_00395 [Candidatus Sericytochromatia bacterium]|nr:hypothetical protein [Candidatus Sericytochromatia bacterium]
MAFKIRLTTALLLLSTSTAIAADKMGSQPSKAVYGPFKAEQILLPGQIAYRKEKVSLSQEHQAKTWMLSRQFSKQLALANSPRKLLSQLEFFNFSASQAVSPQFACPAKQQKSSYKHPQLGSFLICSQVLDRHQGLPLIGARIFPVKGNRNTKTKITYTGTEKDLKTVLASLKTGGNWSIQYTKIYPPNQLGQLNAANYTLYSSRLIWNPQAPKPTLEVNYLKSIHLQGQGIRAHLMQRLKHHPQSQLVKANFRCPPKSKQQEYRHPQWGPSVICYEERALKAHPKARNQRPLMIRKALIYPRTGNKLPHLSLSFQVLAQDLLPLLNSLNTLGHT